MTCAFYGPADKSHSWTWIWLQLICSLFHSCVRLMASLCICVHNSARRPAGPEWSSAEWSVWHPKANRPNTAVLQKDPRLKLRVKTENVSQTPFQFFRLKWRWAQVLKIIPTFLIHKVLSANRQRAEQIDCAVYMATNTVSDCVYTSSTSCFV